MRFRLGRAVALGPGATCLNEKAATGDPCGELLDQHGDHAVQCERGRFRNLRHESIADVYGDIMAETGGMSAGTRLFQSSRRGHLKHGWMCGATGRQRFRTACST